MKIRTHFCDYPSAYLSFEEVPESRKLHNYEQQFEGVDLWARYVSEQYDSETDSEEAFRNLERASTSWKNMCTGNCHHGCASPSIINDWSVRLVTNLSAKSANMRYLRPINKFYRFLMWHMDYPHSYNPVQFAVNQYSETEELWNARYGDNPDE